MLYLLILKLLHENRNFTTINPILNTFSLDYCEEIDTAANHEEFIKIKRKSIINSLQNYTVGHNIFLKQALDYYNEAVTYLFIKNKNILVERITESQGKKTPDFRVKLNNETFYIEMKTLGFANGELNYYNAINEGLNAQVSLEEQIKAGREIAVAEAGISPFNISNKGNLYNNLIQTRVIEIIINKINNNLKEEQFSLGKTILFIDLSLMLMPYDWRLNSVPIFQEKLGKSMVSGIFWHSAFGKVGERIFSAIEFEGARNIEGELSVEGILNNHSWIQALCFQTYNISRQRKVVCLHREKDKEMIDVLHPLCDFFNDEFNTNGYEVLQAGS
ncbi:hypothetical protein [Nostoc sp.]|uniref:hypothetical protein n=1 Tax=Nostoc sp. TaxID=1180 RepID=UPI002FF52C98